MEFNFTPTLYVPVKVPPFRISGPEASFESRRRPQARTDCGPAARRRNETLFGRVAVRTDCAPAAHAPRSLSRTARGPSCRRPSSSESVSRFQRMLVTPSR